MNKKYTENNIGNYITIIIRRLYKQKPETRWIDIAEAIGYTEQGLHKALKDSNLKINTIYHICEYLNVDVIKVIREAKLKLQGNETKVDEADKDINEEEVKLLEEKLKFREEQLDYYKSLVQRYENQIKKAQ